MTLQLELEGSNIHVIDLQPGDIRTDFNDKIAKDGECRSALPGETPAGLARSRPEHEKSAQS